MTARPTSEGLELPEEEETVECQCCFAHAPVSLASFSTFADAWICDDCRENYS